MIHPCACTFDAKISLTGKKLERHCDPSMRVYVRCENFVNWQKTFEICTTSDWVLRVEFCV